MSDPQKPVEPTANLGQDDTMSVLFAQLVIQQSNMAMMLLGKVAHPESGKATRDLEAARLFIDQLEMLEVKTRGNLSKEESGLLKQSLMSLRLAFVEAADEPAPKAEPRPQSAAPEGAAASGSTADADDEHRKKFSKKY
ncbi:MAG TPA: DUF1844 domain-containing protein [Verrucomicrobiae bacterium]